MLSAPRSIFCLIVLLLLTVASIFSGTPANAQTSAPIAFPNTFNTLAGGSTIATTPGSPCFSGSLDIATDTFGDGCPATLATFGSDTRAGLVTDFLGNVYLGDTSNQLIRKIDPRSGLISILVGGVTSNCATAVDKEGDNCPVANAGNFNSPGGLGTDPYGNIFIAGAGDELIHIVCNTVSPLCTSAQLGTMRVIAGCTTSSTAYGTAGNTGDGTTAAVNGACTVGLNQPAGVNGDRWGNVYIADTGNLRLRVVVGPYNAAVTNPLIAILQQAGSPYSSITAQTAAGKIYAFIGGPEFIVPGAAGQPCFSSSSSLALDVYGNGCPFFNTSIDSSVGFVRGVSPDTFGNIIFQDGQGGTGHLRVVYAGGANNPMATAVTANNATIGIPQPGFVYNLAGGGSINPLNVNPVLGSTTSLDTSLYRTISDTFGNIYMGDDTQVLFFDINTGYIRKLATNGTICATALNTIGDGCSSTQAIFGGSNSVLGLGLDNLGNLYIEDGVNHLIRKLSATDFGPNPDARTLMGSIVIHGPPGTTSFNGAVNNLGGGFNLGTPSCVLHAPTVNPGSGDNTADCTTPVTFNSSDTGLRSYPISFQAVHFGTHLGSPMTTSLTANSVRANLVFDPSSPATPQSLQFGPTHPTLIAIDGQNVLYAVDSTTNTITQTAVNTPVPISAALPTAPAQLAVDLRGNVYAAIPNSPNIVKLSLNSQLAYTSGTFTIPGITGAKAIAVDANLNTYIADTATNAIIRFSQTTGLTQTLTAAPLSDPVALALDPNGNLLIADKGAGVVYKLPTSGIASGLPPTVATTGISAPVAITSDAAGIIYIADSSSKQVVSITPSGVQSIVFTGLTSPSGLAVQGLGNIFISDSAATGFIEVLRQSFTFDFGIDTTLTLKGTISNSGNAAASGLGVSSNDFNIHGSDATCPTNGSSVLPGESCSMVASFTPVPDSLGARQVTGTVAFIPPTFGTITLTGSKSGATVPTTTILRNQTPTAPVYVGSGTTVAFNLAVTATSGVPQGNVRVQLEDSNTSTVYPLNSSGTATITFTAVPAGGHTVLAVYQGDSTHITSTGNAVFNVAQANLFLTASNPTSVYGAPLPPIAAVYSGLALGDTSATAVTGTPVFTTTPAIPASAGTYPITVSAGNLHSPNYNLVLSNGVRTITKVPLTVTAPTLNVTYGSPMPAFLPIYTGLVNGDTAATAVTGTPVLATLPAVPVNVGTYSILAAAGTLISSNYALTFVNGSLTISKAIPTITLSSSSATVGTGYSVIFTAAVTGATGQPTGTVVFSSGAITLGTATLTSGVVTLTTSFPSVGTSSITAVYSGDANFTPLTSAPLTETVITPDLAVTVSPSTLNIIRGFSGTTTFTLTPTGNYQGAANLSCSGLPLYTTCTFTPATLTLTGNNAIVTAQLQITTTGPVTRAKLQADPHILQPIPAEFLIPGTFLGALFTFRRRRLPTSLRNLFTLLLLATGLIVLNGCGGSSSANNTYTPIGTDSITITANIAGSTPSVDLTVNITQ